MIDEDDYYSMQNAVDSDAFFAQIDGWKCQCKYVQKTGRKRQHLLSIVHFDANHKDIIKPLYGVPILLNLYCESRINLFSLQYQLLGKLAKIMMDEQIYLIKSAMSTDFFRYDNVVNLFKLVVRRQFVEYGALDSESMVTLKQADCRNIVCLRFEQEHAHLFKQSFTASIDHCRKHISAPPTSMGWRKTADFTEKRLIRKFRKKKPM